MLKPLREPALNRAIQDHIKQYITDNHKAPGDALPSELQFAQDLGVSRNSVREAVRALASLGIIEVRHGNGIFVRDFNFDSVFDLLSYGLTFDSRRIRDILQIRKWLEIAAVGEVAQRIGEGELQGLEDVLARWERRIAAGEPTALEDREFHRLLFQVLNNPSLTGLIDIFWLVFNNVRIQTITMDPSPVNTVHDHREILEAVRRRDAKAARQCIQGHFRNLEERVQVAAARVEAAAVNDKSP